MPATSWTEQTATAPVWAESITAPSGFSGFALFGMPIPIENGIVFGDSTASWTESSGTAPTWTEQSVSVTTWVEAT